MDTSKKINELKFCNEYIRLSQRYWDLADETIIAAIDDAMDSTIGDKISGKSHGMFQSMSEKDIKKYFTAKKLKIYATIPDGLADIVCKDIDKFLRNNIIVASGLRFNIPPRGEHLKLSEYYVNFLLAELAKKRLDLLLGYRK
ncbi:MAG: hypothetical protein Q4C44_04530 [bacterium]|nr:hypothetical protein [bacterium]